MKKEVPSSNLLATIQDCAKSGVIGSNHVRRVNIDILVVENSSKTVQWLLDAETGVRLEVADNTSAIQQVVTGLTSPQHVNAQLEVIAINTTSKWSETVYVYLPLSVKGVEVYEGVFQATRLDFVDQQMGGERSAAEMIGLSMDEIANPLPGRLWNVTGSVRHNNGEFNRKVEMDECLVEFSSNTGKYRLTKKESCAQYYAPLTGLSQGDIPVADLLDGLQAAPLMSAEELFAKRVASQQYKR